MFVALLVLCNGLVLSHQNSCSEFKFNSSWLPLWSSEVMGWSWVSPGYCPVSSHHNAVSVEYSRKFAWRPIWLPVTYYWVQFTWLTDFCFLSACVSEVNTQRQLAVVVAPWVCQRRSKHSFLPPLCKCPRIKHLQWDQSLLFSSFSSLVWWRLSCIHCFHGTPWPCFTKQT